MEILYIVFSTHLYVCLAKDWKENNFKDENSSRHSKHCTIVQGYQPLSKNQISLNFPLTCMPGSQALSAVGHDADKGGHEDAGDGGQHVCQSHQGARKVGR